MNNLKREKVQSIEGLRLILFFAVVLEHAGLYIGIGEWAVSMFLMISGFCAYLSKLGKEYRPISVRGIWRNVNFPDN